MPPIAQLSDYVEFVYGFYTEEQEARARRSYEVENEFNRQSAQTRQDLLGLIDQIDAIQEEMSQHYDTVLTSRKAVCDDWDRNDQAQQADDQDAIDGLWETLFESCQKEIDLLESFLTTISVQQNGLPWLIHSLNERWQDSKAYLGQLLQERDELGELKQAIGEKQWESKTDPAPDSEVYKLCQSQVLGPAPTVRSETPDSRAIIPHHLRQFQGDRRIAVSWIGRSIGSGGQGDAWVYTLSEDFSGKTLNTIVRKDSMFHPDEFRDPQNWQGDTSSPTFGNECVPMEYHTQDLVSTAAESHAVKLLAPPQVLWEELTTRLYMEFAPNGDGDAIIDLHSQYKEPVPETFLWLIFDALVKTALIMDGGQLYGMRKGAWAEIVHRDLKAGNVFFGEPQDDFFPQYPTPKVGDFGMAFPTDCEDETNPIMWSEKGTEGCYAPEQLNWIDSKSRKPWKPTEKILSSCNTYGIGIILYQLMERSIIIPQPTRWAARQNDEDEEALPDDTLKLSDDTKDLYSAELSNWTESCLLGNPKDRPNLPDLHITITNILYGEKLKKERDEGWVDPLGDTLLLPNRAVNLQWASRLHGGGLDSRGVRKPRDAEPTSSDESEPESDDSVMTAIGVDDEERIETESENEDHTDTGSVDEEMTDVEDSADEYTDEEMTDVES